LDIDSEISADEWGEVQRFNEVLDREARLKEKEDYIAKQRTVK
jgi:hypothetical protein